MQYPGRKCNWEMLLAAALVVHAYIKYAVTHNLGTPREIYA